MPSEYRPHPKEMRCRSLSAPISIFSRLRVLCASVVKSPPPCPLNALWVPAACQRNAVPLPLSTHFHLLSSLCPLCLRGEISPSVSSLLPPSVSSPQCPLGTGRCQSKSAFTSLPNKSRAMALNSSSAALGIISRGGNTRKGGPSAVPRNLYAASPFALTPNATDGTTPEATSALTSQRSSSSLVRTAVSRSSPSCSVPGSIGCGFRKTSTDHGASSIEILLSGPGPKLMPLTPDE